VSPYDFYDCSTYNKKDLIHLIRKFLRNNNNKKPLAKDLKKLDRRALYKIWVRNKPNDLFKNIIEDEVLRK
jgi:hypothetical protein